MSLSSRDRAKVTAALVIIRDAGRSPDDVTRIAQASINIGTPPLLAYERAFSKFCERVPAFQAPLQRLGQLIETTDDRTLASYSVALNRYIETGEATALQAILPTMQHDMAEMAVRTGDAGFADGLGTLSAPAQPAAIEALSPAATRRPGWDETGYRAPKPSPDANGSGENAAAL